MDDKETPKNVIDSYRRRQQAARRAPIVIGVAVVLLVAGAALLIFWLLGPNKPQIKLFTTPTSTATETATLTPIPTKTATATVTVTVTPTLTPTSSPTMPGPFLYQVLEGDSCYTISQKFKVDLGLLIVINNLDPTCPIQAGLKITIPGPDTQLPTETPLPPNLKAGTKIVYRVMVNDSLGSIALKFNSTVEAIKKENNITNENEILVGQELSVPVNIVTPVPSSTPIKPSPTGPTPTSTRAVINTPTATKKP